MAPTFRHDERIIQFPMGRSWASVGVGARVWRAWGHQRSVSVELQKQSTVANMRLPWEKRRGGNVRIGDRHHFTRVVG